MSAPLASIKDRLAEIDSMISRAENLEVNAVTLRLRLQKVVNVVVENEGKIWLRTKVGQPMVKMLQDSVDKALEVLKEQTPSPDRFDDALTEVERQTAKIDEESRRRSMVVT